LCAAAKPPTAEGWVRWRSMTLLSGKSIEQLEPPESVEAQHKALVRYFVEEVRNKGNLDVLPNLVIPELLPGFRQQAQMLREAFGDYRVEIQSLTAEGTTVVLRALQHGVHQGTYLGVAPTNHRVTWTVVRFFEFSGGRISETWVLADELALLRQVHALS
jgi:predicted ester cyclase